MNYELLLKESDSAGLIVKEKPLKYNDGRIKGRRVAIRKDIKTTTEKGCILAEELGHYHTSTGDILNQNDISNRKQELHARAWAYDKMIGLNGIISAYKHGCRTKYDIAQFLDVTEGFLYDALKYYSSKFGIYTRIDNYIIYFEPTFGVFELI